MGFMNKWTLQLTTTVLFSFAILFGSCDDAGFEDTEGGGKKIELDGTSWNIIQQKIEIEPAKEFETTVNRLNTYYKDRLETLRAEQTFDMNYSLVSFYSKINGDKLFYDEYKYQIQKDSIYFTDLLFGEEKGKVKLSGNRITFNTVITKLKLNNILVLANIDPNINDGLIKEIKYTVVADKISK